MGSVLNPVKELTVNGKTVQVRELRAVDGLQFIKRLADFLGDLQPSKSNGEVAVKISELVCQSTDLAQHLVLKSTGNGEQWLSEISTEEFVDVLEAAVDLNLHQDLVKKIRGVVASIKAKLGPQTP